MESIGVLTSGGDAPGMNSALRAVVKASEYHNLNVLGIKYGYQGLLDNEFKQLSVLDVEGINRYGGSILKTSRTEEFKTESGFKRALSSIQQNNLTGLIVIGGDGSLRGAKKLSQAGVKTIGIPATIDNDIPGTDYCIGYNTACGVVTGAVDRVLDTATTMLSDNPRLFILEVMGRKSGQLALQSSLASSSDILLIPERELDYQQIVNKLQARFKAGKTYGIILLAEGVASVDQVTEELEARLGFKVKPILLGHQQRGGNPTVADRILASKLGVKAVNLLNEGRTNQLVGMSGDKIVVNDLAIIERETKQIKEEDYELGEILRSL